MKLCAIKLVALCIGCVAALTLLEMGLRIFNPIEIRIRGDEIVLPTNRKYVFENSSNLRGIDRTVVHTKNALGFRGADLPKRGLEHFLSVIAVGGSTTECAFLSDGKDWPALIAEYLKNDFGPVWLNNAGLDGFSTFGYTVLLRDMILKLKPKVLIFLVGANDMARKEAGEHSASHIKGSIRLDSIEGFVKSASAYSEVASVALNSYRYLRARASGLPHQNLDIVALPHATYPDPNLPELLEPHIHTFVPAFEQRLQTIIRLAKDFQIDPVLITQPSLLGRGIDPSTGIDLRTIKFGRTTGRTYWTTLELYNQATREVGIQENVLTIDLAEELEKDSKLFYDALHFTNTGAAEVARIIYKHLNPYVMENYGSFRKSRREMSTSIGGANLEGGRPGLE